MIIFKIHVFILQFMNLWSNGIYAERADAEKVIAQKVKRKKIHLWSNEEKEPIKV